MSAFGSLAAAPADSGRIRFTPEGCRGSRRTARQLWAMRTHALHYMLQVGICRGKLEALNWYAPGAYDSNLRSCAPSEITSPQLAKTVVEMPKITAGSASG